MPRSMSIESICIARHHNEIENTSDTNKTHTHTSCHEQEFAHRLTYIHTRTDTNRTHRTSHRANRLIEKVDQIAFYDVECAWDCIQSMRKINFSKQLNVKSCSNIYTKVANSEWHWMERWKACYELQQEMKEHRFIECVLLLLVFVSDDNDLLLL